MKKAVVLKILKKCADNMDNESAHVDADAALVAYIDDPEITAAYQAVPKWYA